MDVVTISQPVFVGFCVIFLGVCLFAFRAHNKEVDETYELTMVGVILALRDTLAGSMSEDEIRQFENRFLRNFERAYAEAEEAYEAGYEYRKQV